METVGGGETAWFAQVLLCGVKVNFKLDTVQRSLQYQIKPLSRYFNI